MKRLTLIGIFFAAALLAPTAQAASLVEVEFAPPGTWGSTPVYVTAPQGDKRVFIVERGNDETGIASIRVAEDGVVKAQPFLTISNVDTFFERGLLSMAFPPDYATSGLFYVFTVAEGPDALDLAGQAGDIRIVEYQRSATDPDTADPTSARLVLKNFHPAGNHNGGWMAFGPDGLLYITIGDDADAAKAQSLSSLSGKVLRIDPADPDGGGPLTATIPADNPFVGNPTARKEVYTYGLRNPYRASFTPDGVLTVADVGQGDAEEVNAGNLAGKNMGWPACEGFCAPPNPALTDPVFDYPHSPGPDTQTGCAVIGGHVVRDPQLTGLTGRYLYGDLCRSDLRTLGLKDAGASPGPAGIDIGGLGQLLSFGEDSRGCIYVVTSQSVYRVAPSPTSASDCPYAVLPPPPDPDDLPDVTFNSYIPKKRPLALKIQVAGKCSIACSLTASGTVRITRNRFRKKPGRVKLLPASRAAEAGARTPLVMRIPVRRIAKIRKAARNGSRLVANVTVKAVATDGSGGSGTSQIRLIPRKRR